VILNPAVISLIGGSLLSNIFMIRVSWTGIEILNHWDIRSGSTRQLALERKTYLVSTFVKILMVCQIASLFLFVHTADHVHTEFVGAMCAAGTLAVNAYGYPTLMVKILVGLLCGVWVLVNRADGQAPDYPLIRFKYKTLLALHGLFVLDLFLQWGYFAHLNPDVITSCCGLLFGDSQGSLTAELAHLPPQTMQVLFFASAFALLRIGIQFILKGRPARGCALAGIWFTGVCLASLISFISLYFYQLPSHHCPFCILQKEYGYVGYPLYLAWLVLAVFSAGIGVLDRFRSLPSLREVIPGMQRRFCGVALLAGAAFVLITLYPMVFWDFKLGGY
jgi:hypothetical protein